MPADTPSAPVDPELLPLLDLFPAFEFTPDNLPERRAAVVEMQRAMPPLDDAIVPEEQFVPGPDGSRPVRVLVWRTPGASGPLPAVLHIHGGGYVLGSPDQNKPTHRAIVELAPCVVVAPQYALAPEQPHPAPVEDCYAALRWMQAASAELGIDPARIGVSGESAGGGLAAALALLARDRGEVSLAFQHLIFPMLDDRTCVDPDPHPHAGQHVWTAESNRFGWTSLLAAEPGSEGISPYAAPARAPELSGLPPTYISVGALDLFVEENLEYARRLMRAAVPVELHVYPGAYHAFNVSPTAAVAQQARRDSAAALVRFLAG